MEESFSSLQDFVAKRLVMVNYKPKRETSSLSKPEKKKFAPDVQGRLELEKADENSPVAMSEPDFVRVEKNIASFGFFTPSSKRISNVPKIIRFTQTVDGNRVEAQVKISGNVEYGMPITADQDKYLAFQKIIERVKRERGTVQNPITFTTAELLALLGTSKNGNRYREVEEWLKVMNATFIESEGAVWLNGKKRFASDSFVIFQRVKRTGQELDDGTLADRNYVWLSDWYLENLNAHYLLPIEFETYKLLKNNISKALIPLLQIWLYASREAGVFEKRYSELCQILNVREYQHRSKIKEKLAPSLDELAALGYLKTWEIEKTADGKDFKIVFRHGYKFYADQTTLKQLGGRRGKKSENSPTEPRKSEKGTEILKRKEEAVEAANFASEEIRATKPDTAIGQNLPTLMTAEHLEAIRQLHIEHQVAYEKSISLAVGNLEETVKQLAAFRFRDLKPKNRAGFLIEAIERKYSLPEDYFLHLQKLERERERAEEIERDKIWLAEHQAKITACGFCDEGGHRYVKMQEDPNYKALHLCTHDEEKESLLEDWK